MRGQAAARLWPQHGGCAAWGRTQARAPGLARCAGWQECAALLPAVLRKLLHMLLLVLPARGRVWCALRSPALAAARRRKANDYIIRARGWLGR